MERFFAARLDDMARKAANGEICAGDFFNPAQTAAARAYFHSLGVRCAVWGGYSGAERALVSPLPGWAEELEPDQTCRELEEYVRAVRIKTSGYVELTHRDYLGAILASGTDGDKIGDICPDAGGAVVFCRETIAAFWLSAENPLTKIGRDTVSVETAVLPEGFDGGRRFQDVTGVAASPRLDAVLAAITPLSREKAKETIRGGAVMVNFAPVTDADSAVGEGDILSVRGVGRFRIISFRRDAEGPAARGSAEIRLSLPFFAGTWRCGGPPHRGILSDIGRTTVEVGNNLKI
jgi:RNA-binding protein YlmH